MIRIALHRQVATDLAQREMMHELMHALAGTGEPIVDGGNGLDHLTQNAGLLVHLAHGGLLRRLALFDMALGKAPFEMAVAGVSRDDGHTAALVEHQAAGRVFAHHRELLSVQRRECGRPVARPSLRHHRRRGKAWFRWPDNGFRRARSLGRIEQRIGFERILGMVARSMRKHAREVCGRNHDFHLTQYRVQVG